MSDLKGELEISVKGVVLGVTAAEAAEAGPVPETFVAVTLNV